MLQKILKTDFSTFKNDWFWHKCVRKYTTRKKKPYTKKAWGEVILTEMWRGERSGQVCFAWASGAVRLKSNLYHCLLHTNNHSMRKLSRNKCAMLKSWVSFTFSKTKHHNTHKNSEHLVNSVQKRMICFGESFQVREPEFCLTDLGHYLILCSLFALYKNMEQFFFPT